MKHRRRLASVPVLVSALMVGTALWASAASPGRNGRLVYERAGGIWVRTAQGAEQRIVGPGLDPAFPSWSPDGKWVVFEFHHAVTNQDQVATIRADGTGFRRLTDDAVEADEPAWAPDGLRIVYSRYLTGQREQLVTIRADGGGLTPLTDPGDDEYHYNPTWSPDGRTIAFALDANGARDVMLMDPDGSDVRPFADTVADETYPAWSPDSRRIAYARAGEVVVGTIGQPGYVLLAEDAYSPEWSPDGRWIVYAARRTAPGGPEVFGIYKRRTDGSGEEILVVADGADPSWQPRCNLTGTSDADTLTGTSRPELICGRGGADTIDGRGGNDIIFAGPGNDTVKGGAGDDVLVGQEGSNRLNGGAGIDRCVQGPGGGTRTACES